MKFSTVYFFFIYSSMPTMPSYTLSSNNIQANPACLQSSNASSYSCMIPGTISTIPYTEPTIKVMRFNLYYPLTHCCSEVVSLWMWKTYVISVSRFFVEYAPRSYDPLSLSNYPRPSCNPAAGMQSHMTHNNHPSAASTGEQIYFSSY